MRLIIICLIVFSFMGCKQQETHTLLLQQADSLMESRPDSALAILREIPNPQKLRGKTQADYCLLATQAAYKNYLPFTSDSLLSIAIDYYQSVDDLPLLGKAFYYKGCFYKENNDLAQAAKSFKQAEVLLKGTDDSVMLSLLYNSMGVLNRKSGLNKAALSEFRKSLIYTQKTRNTYHIVLNLQEVANGYLRLDKPDSAGIYFNQIIPYLSECEELKYASIFHNIGIYNEDYGDLNLAEKFILKSLELKKSSGNRTVSHYALARIYRKQGKVGASDSLWNVVLNEAEDIRIKRGVYQTLFEQSFAEGKYKEAALYAEKQAVCNDSIYRTSIAKEIAEVYAKYDNEVLLCRNAEQQVERMTLWICIVGVVIIGSSLLFIIVYSHKKYKAQKEREIRTLIVKYQEELDSLNEERSESKDESERLIFRIKEKEEQIELLNKKVMSKENVQFLVLEGLELDLSLRSSISRAKMQRIETFQFRVLIAYYNKILPDFIQALEVCNLTDYEIVICILFSIPLSHKQVCEVLSKNSETLSRVKLRLKSKIKENGNEGVFGIIHPYMNLGL